MIGNPDLQERSDERRGSPGVSEHVQGMLEQLVQRLRLERASEAAVDGEGEEDSPGGVDDH
jgi:hypothetical protein